MDIYLQFDSTNELLSPQQVEAFIIKKPYPGAIVTDDHLPARTVHPTPGSGQINF